MAKVTAGAILTEARAALNDPSAIRWTDSILYRYIYEGEMLMSGNHPEVQYDTKVENPQPVLLSNSADYTTIHVYHSASLVHYVCFRALLEDSDDAGNQKLAMNHFNLYRNALEDVPVGR